MNIHLVAFLRNGRIETVVKLTKSLHLAQLAFLDAVNKCNNDDAKEISDLFGDLTLEDNVHYINHDSDGPLIIQLFTWDQEV